jgi:hypothetical protein
MPDKREDIATSISRAQEKMDLKREKKNAKRLAKLQRQVEEGSKENQDQPIQAEAAPSKPEKKAKVRLLAISI